MISDTYTVWQRGEWIKTYIDKKLDIVDIFWIINGHSKIFVSWTFNFKVNTFSKENDCLERVWRQQHAHASLIHSLLQMFVCKWTQYDEIEFLLLGYRPILFARDLYYFGSIGGFDISDSAEDGTIVSANIHTIVIIIVMIASHTRVVIVRSVCSSLSKIENTLCNLISFLSHRQYTRTCKILSHLDRVITEYIAHTIAHIIYIFTSVYIHYIYIYTYTWSWSRSVLLSPARSK